MTWWDIEPLARAGWAVRRAVWPTSPALAKSLRFAAGAGTDRAVAVLRIGSTEAVLESGDLTSEDLTADDWRAAQ